MAAPSISPSFVPSSVSPRLLRGVTSLADLAAASGRDVASSLLKGILRELQAPARPGA